MENVAIDNFSAYASLAAGITNAGVSTKSFPANAAFAAEESNGEGVLLGVKEDGTLEQVTLMQEGKRLTQQLNLNAFLGGNIFSAASYAPFISSSLTPINQAEGTHCLIDSKTGKYYPLPKDLGNHASLFLGLHVKEPSLGQDYQTNAAFYEYGNAILFAAKTSERDHDFYTYYSAEVVNGELKIEERIKSSGLPGNDFCFADRYGNMYFTDEIRQSFNPNLKRDITDYPISAILTAAGTLKRPENKPSMFLSLNGVAYLSDLSHSADAQGNLVENALQTCGLTMHPSALLFTEGNVSYYFDSTRYEQEETSLQGQGNYIYTYSIYKVTRLNDIEFTYEKIPFLESPESLSDDSGVFKYQHAAAGGKFFYLQNNAVVEVEPDTGERTPRTFDFVFQFNTIEGDALGNIYYTGINSSAKQVTGIIFPDGTYTENVSEVPFRVSYIQPLN